MATLLLMIVMGSFYFALQRKLFQRLKKRKRDLVHIEVRTDHDVSPDFNKGFLVLGSTVSSMGTMRLLYLFIYGALKQKPIFPLDLVIARREATVRMKKWRRVLVPMK